MSDDTAASHQGEMSVGESTAFNETLAGVQVDAEPPPPPSTREHPDIFVSYRESPDRELAAALKRLLESAFTPTPKVFVSGLGGLGPNEQGFREQIRQAATHAKVYFAIMTPASKDREWLLFEAGAAFGAGVPYFPVLFGLNFSDLPSTIAGSQGYLHSDKEGLQRGLERIAGPIECEFNGRFGNRYRSFIRAVRNHEREQKLELEEEDDLLATAMSYFRAGERELAKQTFDQALDEAKGDEDRCRCEIARHVFLQPDRDLESFLYGLDAQLRETVTWAYWAAMEEGRPGRELQLRQRIVQASPESVNIHWIVHSLAVLLKAPYKRSVRDDAEERLVQILGSEQPKHHRAAAKALIESHPSITDVERLLLCSVALVSTDYTTYSIAAESADRLGLELESLYLRERAASGDGDHELVNYGIQLGKHNLNNLAYLAYAEATEKGATVSLVNMAVLLKEGVAAAGLRLVEDQEKFDARSRAYPYSTRAELEAIVQAERTKHEELIESARESMKAIAHLCEHGLRQSPKPEGKSTALGHEDGWIVEMNGDCAVTKPNGTRLPMTSMVCVHNAYFAHDDEHVLIGAADDDGWLLAVLPIEGERRLVELRCDKPSEGRET